MDEYCMQQLKEFEGYKLICVTKEGLVIDDLEGEDQRRHDELVASYSLLCEVMKEIIGDQVEKVVVSDRIQKSPGCLVTGQYGWTANMERIMKAQALRDSSLSSYMGSKKTFEINPHNKIIQELKRRVDLDRTDKMIRDLAYLLFDVTLIVSGFSIENPSSFSERVSRILELGLNINEDEVEELELIDEGCMNEDVNEESEEGMKNVD
eukprot:1393165-Amorphochlora_amoeboformis.AAC.2